MGALVDEQEAAAATEVVTDEVKQELVEGTEREAAGCRRESGVAFQDDFPGRAWGPPTASAVSNASRRPRRVLRSRRCRPRACP
jgi:hypothetical protein